MHSSSCHVEFFRMSSTKSKLHSPSRFPRSSLLTMVHSGCVHVCLTRIWCACTVTPKCGTSTGGLRRALSLSLSFCTLSHLWCCFRVASLSGNLPHPLDDVSAAHDHPLQPIPSSAADLPRQSLDVNRMSGASGARNAAGYAVASGLGLAPRQSLDLTRASAHVAGEKKDVLVV